MSYYDDSSLFLSPNGYKTSVLFAQKPMDANGQLAFTRSNDTATRIAENGLIQKVRTNLVLQSETFDNASWNKSLDGQVTITANAAAAPNGTTTADKMIPSAIAGFHCVQQQVTLSAGEASVSVYAKAAENSFLQIFDALTTEFVNFNLTTGVVGSSSAYVGSIEDAGNGWYRCKATKVVPSGTFSARIGVVTTATAVRGQSFTGNGTDGLLIWGAQAETGVATDYIPTTTAAVSVGPVANLPRIDYTGGGCGKLLLEPQRTNLVTFSESFDNAAWTKSNASVTANQTTSPSGYDDADLIDALTGTGQHFISAASITYTNAVPYTFSVFAKKGNTSLIQLFGASGVFGSNVWATYNFDTLEVTAGSQSTASMVDYGSGWYRLILTGTVTSVATVASFYAAFTNDKSVRLPSFTAANQTFYLWGAQTEQASYATSYIPTLAASVTRGADACSKTGISSLIGQTEGTIFAEANIRANKDSVRALQASDGTTNNRIQLAFINNNFSPAIVTGGVIQAAATVPFTAGNNKFAIAYANNDVVAYLNGVQVLVDNLATIPACSLLDVGQSLSANSNTLGDSIAQALLFKTRLSNSELAQLTTI